MRLRNIISPATSRLAPLCAALLFCCLAAARAEPPAESAAAAKKKNLEEISRQLDEKKKELDVYRAEEERIVSELAGMKKAEKQSLSRRQDLEWQLDRSRARSGEALQKYESLEKSRKELDGDISGELVMYSLQKEFFYPYYGSRDLSKDMLIRAAIMNRYALLTSIKGESVRINKDIVSLKLKSVDLKARQDLLLRQSSAHKNELKNKREELERTKAQQARLSVELENLHNSALGLTRLVKTLQKRAPYRSDADPGSLPLEKRSLPWPAEGKILSRFGREEVPALKTWIVREGVRISTPKEAAVRAVLAGKVIYCGPFRAYGNVVIVDHEKGFFTIYGLLSRIDAVKGQAVEALTALGTAGEDTQSVGQDHRAESGAVYFEIRKGDRALDPMQWLAN
ncbi:MAG TPA: peptidoglycan DD-metalloendopeptidase family protein [Elusimicrobiales bacterium]|nr:peptidoglycan DD-metalloendopeptidase family protein [Elusimicrobiales bacterium]